MMSEQKLNCNQGGCSEAADYRFTWPGENERGICEAHAEKLRGITQAMGLHVQLIQLEPKEQ